MNWFQRIFYKEEKQVSTAIFPVNPQPARVMDMSPDQISQEAYRKLTIAYRCVGLIAGAVSGMKLNLFNKAGEEIDQHPVIDLLTNPNPMDSYMTFTNCAISFFALHGNLFIQGLVADETQGKPPVRLFCHRTSRMKIVPGKAGAAAAYIVRLDNSVEVRFEVDVLGRSQIMHMKTFNPLDDWWGQSPVTSAATDVDTLNSANRWNLSLLQNSARPSGVFFYNGEGTLDDPKKRQLRKDIDMLWTGEVEAGKPLVLGGKIDFKELSLTPKDMDFLNSKKVSKGDIALAFGIPGQLVGVEGSQTFSNYEQAQLSFYVDTAIPIAKMWVERLNNWLLPSYKEPGLHLKIDFDSILALEPLRKVQWEKAKNADWLTPDEKRELTGYEPWKDSDNPAEQLYISSSLIPLGASDDFESVETTPDDDNDKSFNINSQRGKRQFWLAQNRKRDRLVKRMRAQLNAAFRKEALEIIDAIKGVQSQDMLEIIIKEVIADNAKTFEPIFRAHIKETMESFGIATIRSLGKKAAADKLESAIREFIDREVGSKITNISRTSQKRVLKNVREAVLASEIEGLSIPELAKAIEKTYKDFTKKRSLVIARTEIHNASMQGSITAAQSTGVPNLKKEWVANLDARVRDSHADINGTKVGIDEQFEVPSDDGPDMMDGPGDISAPPDQVINCRCVLVYS